MKHFKWSVTFFAEESDDKNKQDFVYISTNEASQNVLDCLYQPEKVACLTLQFVVENIFTKQMFWINTIYLNSYLPGNSDTILLSATKLTSPFQLKITCAGSCVFHNDLRIFAETFHTNTIIVIESVVFENSKVMLDNLHGKFKSVQFWNSSVTDGQHAYSPSRQVRMQFENTTFDNTNSEDNFGLFIQNVFSAVVEFTDSNLTAVSVRIEVPHLVMRVSATNSTMSPIFLSIDKFCHAQFYNSFFNDEKPMSVSKALLSVTSNKIFLRLVSSFVQNGHGGIQLTKRDSYQSVSWMNVLIQKCTFHNISKLGSDGSIQVLYFGQGVSMEKIQMFCMLKIVPSTETKLLDQH